MQAIIFSGLQGAGKSTFYREQFADTHLRINLDMLKTRNREDILLYACLAAQQPFVVDNTNPTKQQRTRYLRLALAAGFEAMLYFFDCPVDDVLRRNALRTGKAAVPDQAIYGTAAKLERPTPDEGFSRIFIVRKPSDDAFVVEEMQL